MVIESNVLLLPLFFRLGLPTDGTTNMSYRRIEVPEVAKWLLKASALFLIYNSDGRSTNHLWNVFLLPAFAGVRSSVYTPIVSADINTAGPNRSTDMTDKTKFLPETEIFVGAKNSAGSAIEAAVCSAMLGVVL